jgi:hypothetical protein
VVVYFDTAIFRNSLAFSSKTNLVIYLFMELLFLAICAFVWLLPLIIISMSVKTSGREKMAWILAVLFISWGAFIFYLLLAPIRKD